VAVEATLKFAAVQIHKNKFDRRALADKDDLVNCNIGCLPTYVRNRLRKLKAEINVPNNISKNAAPAVEQPVVTGERSPFRPVAQATTATAPTSRLSSVDTAHATVKYMSNAQMNVVNDNTIQLNQGEVVVASNKATSIATENGKVQLAPDTVALVRRKGNIVTVSVIWEGTHDAARFVSQDRAVKIAVGSELVGTVEPNGLDKFLKNDSVGRRRVKVGDLPSGGSVMTSEVSFLSVLANSPVLRQLFKSEDDNDKAICKKLTKMAVALSVVTNKHGSYAPVQGK
jgi:hypothetical protein